MVDFEPPPRNVNSQVTPVDIYKQERQGTYNIAFRRVPASTVAVEEQ